LVIGGTINLESPLVIRVEKVGADTVLSGIVRLAGPGFGGKAASWP
jgi:Cu2+-exporting ATPase